MKKILLATALFIGGSTVATAVPAISAEAKQTQYKMTDSELKLMKQGSLKEVKGKVGMTYKELKKLDKRLLKKDTLDSLGANISVKNGSIYYTFNTKKVTDKSKVTSITYDQYTTASYFSYKQFTSVLGKAYAVNKYHDYNFLAAFTTGKYKAYIRSAGETEGGYVYSKSDVSNLQKTVGTKAAVAEKLKNFSVEKAK